jgi:thiol:disulfide interchange protein
MKKCTYWFLLVSTAFLWANCPTLHCLAQPTGSPAADSTSRPGINWLTDYAAALKQAQTSNQLVVIDFYTTWCGPCKYMDMTTFADAKVRARLAGFVPLKIDAEKHPELAVKYGPPGWPTMLVIDATGKPVIGCAGYLDPANYLTVLDMAVSKSTATNSVK